MIDSKIGCRIVSNNDKGTIKWEGEVPTIQGLWYGVDWDDTSRGKHNGSCQGIQYFKTRSETSGSFVRPNKIDFGMPIEEALKKRYQNDTTVDDEVTKALQRSMNARFVEFVGMDKVGKQQSDLGSLKIAVLHGWAVNGTAGTDLRSLLPSVRELDLSCSLISSWESLAGITSQLPRLTSLNISGNLLNIPDDLKSLTSSFEHITQLVMNHMLTYDWPQILHCLDMFPNLRKLQVSHNKLTHLSPIDDTRLQQLEELDVGVNHFENWNQIAFLGRLPKLCSLNVNSCLLTNIEFAETEPMCKTELFPKLEALMVASNPLDAWQCSGELNKLQKLTQLIITMDMQKQTYSLEYIFARISSLKVLNRTEVTLREKKDYQSFYLRSFSTEYFNHGGREDGDTTSVSQEFIRNHPSYVALVKEHGAPSDDRNSKSQKTQRIRDLKLELKIEVADRADLQPKIKSFMPNTRISKVRMMIKRTFNLSPSVNVRLCYTYVKDDEACEFELDNDFHDLGYYSVSAGDTIIARLS